MVHRGDPLKIKASEWNEMLAMLRWFKENQQHILAKELQNTYPPTTVWVKNTTSQDRAAFEILSVSDLAVDIRDYQARKYEAVHCDGTTPTNDPLYSYVVLQEPARKNGGNFARAVLSGVTLCKLDITHAQDMWCDINDGVATSLKTHCLGSSRVILKHTGTGSSNKWGLIRVGDRSGEILAKNLTGSTIAAGGSGTASIISGTPNAETTTGQTITVYNGTSVGWADTKKGSVALLGGYGPYVSPQQT